MYIIGYGTYLNKCHGIYFFFKWLGGSGVYSRPALNTWRQSYLEVAIDTHVYMYIILFVLQALILKENAGLLQGSRSSVVRASTAKAGLGSIPSGYPYIFFSQFVSMLIYRQLPILTTRIYRIRPN